MTDQSITAEDSDMMEEGMSWRGSDMNVNIRGKQMTDEMRLIVAKAECIKGRNT